MLYENNSVKIEGLKPFYSSVANTVNNSSVVGGFGTIFNNLKKFSKRITNSDL